MKLSEKMKRLKFVKDHSKLVLQLNIKDIHTEQDFLEVNTYVQSIVKKMSRRSMYLLLDARGFDVAAKLADTIHAIVGDSAEYSKAAAVITDDLAEDVIMSIAARRGLKKMRLFRDAEKAHDFLRQPDITAVQPENEE